MAKIAAGVFLADSTMLSSFVLRFENGLVLKTCGNALLWGNKDQREKMIKDFLEVVDQLEETGFEIERSALDEHISHHRP